MEQYQRHIQAIVAISSTAKNMKPYPPKINFLVKPKSKEICISKTMRVLFTSIFVVLSINFGVVKKESSIVTFLVKTFVVLRTFFAGLYVIIYAIMPLPDPVMIFWYFIYITEFFALVLILLLSKRTTFVEFYEELMMIDAQMSKGVSYRPELVLITGFTLCLSYRFLLSLIYCTWFDDYCISPISALVLFDTFLLCSDIFLVVYFTIYYTLYCRMKNFTRLMKNENASVLANHFLYKSIVDVYDKVRSLHDSLYVVPLVFHTMDLMITIFYPLLQLDQKKTSTMDIVTANISVVQVFPLLFAPAFASGLLASQVDKLRLVLLDRSLKEREEKQKDIERFVRYIEARPMKTVIFKIISLDWKLPVSVLNICVTYLIVMLQFTHKY